MPTRPAATITERLRGAIESAGVTRYRIAKETGVSEAALSRFVHGKQGLDLSSADKLAAYLGLELVKLEPLKSKGR